MPDRWGSGPALAPPDGQRHDGPDRPAPGPDRPAADGAVQHVGGVAYRVGAVREGETPFPFEQAERRLGGKLAGLYGESAVPAVRAALHDAVAADGPGAYDRFGSDPGVFGEVRGDASGAAALGRELRAAEALRAHGVVHGHLVPAGPDAECALTRAPEPGWLTARDAEIAHDTREALVERRAELVREIERHGGGRRTEAEQRLALVDRSVETLDLIGARQDLAFTFKPVEVGDDRGTAGVNGRSDDGRPVIEIRIAGDRGASVAANRVHELYHAGEYARGRVFVRDGPDGRPQGAAFDFYSGNEEVAAYRTQFAFDDRSLLRSSYGTRFSDTSFDRTPRNLADINRSYVEGLRGEGGHPFYSGLQWAP